MKLKLSERFKRYAIIWVILLAAFNAVVFIARSAVPSTDEKFDSRFWVAWGFVIATFIGNLLCAYFALKEENLQKLFYNMPLITISRTALIIMMVAAGLIMAIPQCPPWLGAIICVLILAFNALAVFKSSWAANEIERIDEKVKTQTAFIKGLTVDAENVLARAGSPEIKAECQKVYEAIRYSDPMSNEALSVIEAKMTVKMDELSSAVVANDAEKVKGIAGELVLLAGDRNRKCKALK